MQEEKFYFNQVLTARRRENEKEKSFHQEERSVREGKRKKFSPGKARGRAYLLKVPCTCLSELLAVASVRAATQCIEF